VFILPNKITEDQTFSEEDVALINEIEQRMAIDHEDYLIELEKQINYIKENYDDIESSFDVMKNNSPNEDDIPSDDWLKAKVNVLDYIIRMQDLNILQLEYDAHISRLSKPLNAVILLSIHRQELILLDKSAKVENSRKCTKVLVSSTDEKWFPYREQYNELIAEGIKSSVALNKIGNKIEAAIKESPANKPFKNRPDISTIRRQLVTNRK